MNEAADLINSGIRLSTPILFAAIASLLSARAGVLNLAIESKMLAGAFAAILAAAATGSSVVGVVAGAGAGVLIGGAMAGAKRLGIDLVVLAIGLNILVLEFTVYLMRSYLGGVGTWSPDIERIRPVVLPLVAELPFVGSVLDRLNWLVYVSLLAVVVLGLYFRTRSGRHLLAVGEAPDAAAAAGLEIGRTQTLTLLVAGACAGIGGAFLSVGDLGLFTRNMSADRGWIGITAALLAVNRPAFLLPAAAVFGFADAASIRLQSYDVPPTLTQFLPQAAALLALVLVGLREKSRSSLARLWSGSSRIPLRRPARSPDAPSGP